MSGSYEGEHNGMMYQSLYPNLYRVTYKWVNPASHREVESTVYKTASDEFHARERVMRNGTDVRGSIKVEFVKRFERKER